MCETCLPSRRDVLTRIGGGLGAVGLATVLSDAGLLAAAPHASDHRNPLAPKAPHFTPRAKHLIFLFMNGGPSHIDTFDPKPALHKYAGQGVPSFIQAGGLKRREGKILPSPYKHRKYGQAGIEVTDLFPETARMIDDICVIRSMYSDTANHEPGLLFMNSGNMQPIRPSMGSWLNYALGTENQNLPGFIVLCPGKPVVGPQLWSNSFLPGIYQGTHINNSSVDPQKVIPNVRNEFLSTSEQRRQLDLMQRMNQAHLAERGGADDQLDARIASLEMAFRMQGAAQEAFDLGAKPTTRAAATATASSLTRVSWPAALWSAACASCKSITATTNRGTTTRTSHCTRIMPRRATGQSPRFSRISNLAACWKRRSSCGAANSAERPNQKASGAAITTRWASPCGSPAAESVAVWPTAPPTTWASWPSKTAFMSTTCMPRSCTRWVLTTHG